MPDYRIVNGELRSVDSLSESELMHYGVIGMKWGVRRARRKMDRADRLTRKAMKYDLESAKALKKSDKIHAEKADGAAKRPIKKAAKYEVKAKKLMKKSLSELDDFKRIKIEEKASKFQAKSSKYAKEANQIKRSIAYEGRDEKYARKSDKMTYKADKVWEKLASDKKYVAMMNKKISQLSAEDRNGRYSFVKDMLKD